MHIPWCHPACMAPTHNKAGENEIKIKPIGFQLTLAFDRKYCDKRKARRGNVLSYVHLAGGDPREGDHTEPSTVQRLQGTDTTMVLSWSIPASWSPPL